MEGAESWESLWERVENNAFDFDSYTKLASMAEAELNLDKVRQVLDKFLEAFPLLYGYWKRYAEFEWEHGDKEAGTWRQIYERSVAAVPHSVDIWVYYCGAAADRIEDAAEVESLFERGVAAVGLDYLSGSLWDKYATVMARQSPSKAFAVLRRAVAVPCNKVAELFQKAEGLSSSIVTEEVVSAGELLDLTSRVEAENPGCSAESLEDARKQKLMEELSSQFAVTRGEAEKRQRFEDVLKRFYFTVLPVDDTQLSTWRQYLSFEEAEVEEKNFARLKALYERCIIPCCFYLEFWIRYSRFLEMKVGDVEAAREVLTRAAEKFMTKRPGARLALAQFEEVHGDAGAARQHYETIINQIAPTHLESLIKFANFEKRQGDLSKAIELYTKAVEVSTDAQRPYVAAHAAQCAAQANEADKGREFLEVAKEQGAKSLSFWMAFLSMEATAEEGDVSESRLFAVAKEAKQNLTEAEGRQIDLFLGEHFAFFSSSSSGVREAEFQRRYAALEVSALGGAGQKRGREDTEFGGDKAQKVAAGAVASQGMPMGGYGGYPPPPQQAPMAAYAPPQAQFYGQQQGAYGQGY